MNATIDARFAGGYLEVYVGELIDEPIVQVVAPGYELALFAHEARALADALNQMADKVEPPRILRRSSDIDEQLRERDV